MPATKLGIERSVPVWTTYMKAIMASVQMLLSLNSLKRLVASISNRTIMTGDAINRMAVSFRLFSLLDLVWIESNC